MRVIYHHNAIKKTKPLYVNKPQDAKSEKKKKKLLEWDQAKLDQTQNRLQLLCLHVNGSQMRKVGKRWDSQPLSTNWICM